MGNRKERKNVATGLKPALLRDLRALRGERVFARFEFFAFLAVKLS